MEDFDIDGYLDSLGPMTATQRDLVRGFVAEVVDGVGHGGPEFLREVARYAVTLVLVGGSAELDEAAWVTVRLLHAKHGAAPAEE